MSHVAPIPVSSPPRGDGRATKVCHVDFRQLGDLQSFAGFAEQAARLGFSHVSLGPLFEVADIDSPTLVVDHDQVFQGLKHGQKPSQVLPYFREVCDRSGLELMVDLVLDRIGIGGRSALKLRDIYERPPNLNPLDPRLTRSEIKAATLRPGAGQNACAWWADLAAELAAAGAHGFRLLGLAGLPSDVLGPLVSAICRAAPDASNWAWTPGLDWPRLDELKGSGIAAVFASTCWWDGKSPWYVEEHRALKRVAPVLGVVGEPYARDTPDARLSHRHLLLAAATTDGLFVPGPILQGPADIGQAVQIVDALAHRKLSGELRSLTLLGQPVTVLLRVDSADVRSAAAGVAVAVNTDLDRSHALPLDLRALPAEAGVAMGGDSDLSRQVLQPGEIRLMDVSARQPVVESRESSKQADRRSARAAARRSPVAIEQVRPSVAGGPFPAKAIVGRPIEVEADIFADGHDVLAAEVIWSAGDDDGEDIVSMLPLGNDRWRAAVMPRRIGRHSFVVQAWRDEYGSLCHALEVKHLAGVDISVELEEAVLHLRALPAKPEIERLIAAAANPVRAAAVAELTSKAARALVAALAERLLPARTGAFAVEVERPQAEFAAWYELFPRSLGDAGRHGTFDDVIAALPRIQAMGFDVLYFPPIHPIGKANRKGRNNSLTALPGDPGSPYAIGGEDGGHDALHSELGSPADFRRLVAAAREHGLEIALDFAIQCSLDHPWLRDHPQWFRRRPDGTIKYAENPPKKYEDIVNVDFYGDAAIPDLWLALRDVVQHWVGEGVRLFRVDNPHTKPLPFWQWMIGDIRSRHPDVIFLSEAFTRPKMMYRLAKVGFSQSYTYFTWRNAKSEIRDYLNELTRTEVVDFFRPHFFVNTPDINPIFLQSSGRPGFLIRACLAATLSGLWGVYSGFEICEAAALPGREEYLDSEKYELRRRNFDAPGNIVPEITLLNRLRRMYPALQSHRGVTFYNAFNDQVLVYGKRQPGSRELILIAVSLDPHKPQQAAFEIPLWEWGLPDDGALTVEDLVRGGTALWRGKVQNLRFDPDVLPFALWRLAPEDLP
ncbi:MAG: alpha-1,4-glucan--maltose-1-phosphate maltosyltransferase [Proteobacteria bacterium]|nr:alpha-1,4-glucan--maltose-1-phosphate maltosyltransferase [Pseudomonadota bacterium]